MVLFITPICSQLGKITTTVCHCVHPKGSHGHVSQTTCFVWASEQKPLNWHPRGQYLCEYCGSRRYTLIKDGRQTRNFSLEIALGAQVLWQFHTSSFSRRLQSLQFHPAFRESALRKGYRYSKESRKCCIHVFSGSSTGRKREGGAFIGMWVEFVY